jgi:hypothetical protein
VISTGDCLGARLLPFAILKTGTVYLDPVARATAGNPQAYWIMRCRNGHLASLYPVVAPALATPFYLAAAIALDLAGWTEARLELAGEILEKIAASGIAAISVGLCFLVLRSRARPRNALWLTLAYAFGTSTWATSSQALWQHGPAELLLWGVLLGLVKARRDVPETPHPRPLSRKSGEGWPEAGVRPLPGRGHVGALAFAGLCAGLMIANRPTAFLLVAPIALVVIFERRWRAAWFLIPLAAVVGALLAYNLAVFDQALGGYGVLQINAAFFSHPLLAGLAALLASPSRGLLTASPFFLFLLGRLRSGPGDPPWRRLDVALAAGAALHFAAVAKTDFRGGWSYGPRFLVDILPALVVLLAPVVENLACRGRRIFCAAVVWSVAYQFVGAFCYPGSGQPELPPGDIWSIRHSQPVLEAKAGLASPYLLHESLPPGDRAYAGPFRLISAAKPPGPPLHFHAIAPCRILDTRPGHVQYGYTFSESRSFDFYAAGMCAMPVDVGAVRATLTVWSLDGRGTLSLQQASGFPDRPELTAGLAPGAPAAVMGIVRADGPVTGRITMTSHLDGGSADAAIDVDGYWAP